MPVRTGRLARLARLGCMAAGLAGEAASAAGQVVARGTDAAAERFHRQSAERIAEVLGDMKGLPQKVGQIVSVLDDVLPAEHREMYREVLGRLRSDGAPLGWPELSAVVEAELGRPADAVFARVDHSPVAAASIGQVHRAELHDGRQVAVKVQYPGIARALESDLENIGTLVGALSAVMPRTSVEHLVADVTASFREELDYLHEAEAQAAAAARWAGDPQVTVPAIEPDLCTSRVLVDAWVEGLSFEQACTAPPAQRSAWATTLWRFTWSSVREHHWLHGDPHPGNFVFLPAGQLAVLDFGCTAELPAALVSGLDEAARLAIAGADDDALLAVLGPALGLPTDMAPEVGRAWVKVARGLFAPVVGPQPFRIDRSYTRTLMADATAAKLTMARTALWHGMPTPTTAGAVLFMRTTVGLAAVLARLDAAADFRAAAGL